MENVDKNIMMFLNEEFLKYNKSLDELMDKISQAQKELEKLENEDLPALKKNKDALPEDKKRIQEKIDKLSEEISKHVGEREKVQKDVEGYRQKVFTEYPQLVEVYLDEKERYLDNVFADQVHDFKAEIIENNEKISEAEGKIADAKKEKEKYENKLNSKKEKQSLQFEHDMEKNEELKYKVERDPKFEGDLSELINLEKQLRDKKIRFSRLTEKQKQSSKNKQLKEDLEKLESDLQTKEEAMQPELEEYGVTRENIQQIFVDTDLKFSNEIKVDEAIDALRILRIADRNKEITNFEKDNEEDLKAIESCKKDQEKFESIVSDLRKQNEVLGIKVGYINENVREQNRTDSEQEREDDEQEYEEDLELDVPKENIFKRGWARLKESRFGQAVKRFFSSGKEQEEAEAEENKEIEPLDENTRSKIIKGDDFRQYIRNLANKDKEALNRIMEKELEDKEEQEQEQEHEQEQEQEHER